MYIRAFNPLMSGISVVMRGSMRSPLILSTAEPTNNRWQFEPGFEKHKQEFTEPSRTYVCRNDPDETENLLQKRCEIHGLHYFI